MADLPQVWRQLGIPDDYATARNRPLQREATRLVSIGPDHLGRDCLLAPGAATAWIAMRDSARESGIDLQPVSGFRSVERQAEIIRRKLDRGDRLEDILRVNAAPGFSEHHTGRALDLTDGVAQPLSESFADTPAFAWLSANAGRFGFHLSFPKGNLRGVVFEPWHWCLEANS